MDTQLYISFPLFSPGVFREVEKVHAKVETQKEAEEREHMKHVIAGYKAARTRRKNQTKTNHAKK
jgi:hypothetical protein